MRPNRVVSGRVGLGRTGPAYYGYRLCGQKDVFSVPLTIPKKKSLFSKTFCFKLRIWLWKETVTANSLAVKINRMKELKHSEENAVVKSWVTQQSDFNLHSQSLHRVYLSNKMNCCVLPSSCPYRKSLIYIVATAQSTQRNTGPDVSRGFFFTCRLCVLMIDCCPSVMKCEPISSYIWKMSRVLAQNTMNQFFLIS